MEIVCKRRAPENLAYQLTTFGPVNLLALCLTVLGFWTIKLLDLCYKVIILVS
jgi:hypothetical protein